VYEGLDCLYQMKCESRLLYGAEVCGLEEEWKVTDGVHERCRKNVLKIPKCAANRVAELEGIIQFNSIY
jgi:hypothetical protein